MNAVNLVIKRFLLTTLFFKNFLSVSFHYIERLFSSYKLDPNSWFLITPHHILIIIFHPSPFKVMITLSSFFFYLSFIYFIRILLSFILFFRTRKCNICNKRIEFKETEWIYTTKSPKSFFWHQTSISCVLSLYGG